jgi:hypothetical protein
VQHESNALTYLSTWIQSTTHPFGFEDFHVGVSPHIQPMYIKVLTLRFINQTWHHV